MEFLLSKEQADVKSAAREFAEGEFPSVAKDCDHEERMDMALLEKARSLGFVGAIIPEEYGGPGLGFFENALIVEEFWRVDPGLAQAIISCTFGAEILIAFGNEEQKRRYLTPLVEGNAILATAITEPNSGSDVASAETSAVKDNDLYIINGSKIFITNGSLADHVIVFCKTHCEEASRHRQYSCIIVNADAVGFEANKLKNKLGIRASDTSELVFKEVRVPVENLIGKEQEGFRQVLCLFNRERVTVCAQSTGLAQGALEQAMRHISQRKQFGKPIGTFQAIRFKIAEMATLIEAGRSLYYRAAWSLDNGKENHALVAMAKWFCAQNAVSIVQESLQMHGGYGFFNEFDIARFYRDAKILEIYEGTKEMEKILIANSLLGKIPIV
ncbi:acyl-CoA dehydrogenase family protein [Desulfatiglans anilini]|uniref:acyl-CoA dehydrogenase family protein n=1 Tax=Desulfatiglans anilini TaxID=90728 RepID=UPI000406BC1B|nr:acyl-CoA dehydrogenase family protein [Desulfatiglans anilini]